MIHPLSDNPLMNHLLTAQRDQRQRRSPTGQPLGLVLMSALCLWTLATSTLAADTNPVSSAPPGSYRITSEDGVVRFPFEVFRGDIRFKCEINGHDVHMLLDDGYMWDQLLFWGSPRIDSLGLTYDGEMNVGGSTDEGGLASRTASGITIRFPGVEFTEQTAIVTPFSSGNSTMWSGSEGQVSCTFLKHFVVDINFDSMMMTLIKPEEFEYAGRGVEIPWQPLGFGPWSIPGTLQLDDGRSLWRRVRSDASYLSANDPRLLIGLGVEARALGLRVYWPDGQLEVWPAPPAGRYTTLVQGRAP